MAGGLHRLVMSNYTIDLGAESGRVMLGWTGWARWARVLMLAMNPLWWSTWRPERRCWPGCWLDDSSQTLR